MCGISGFYSEKIGEQEGETLLRKMAATTHHRGPDLTGIKAIPPVYLAHNRLSIIDLSPGGNQPMNHFGLEIVFNGEIYNYLEIRKELEGLGHHFSSSSDTEVILASYKQWGGECVQRFMGMWAFAIWDVATKTLFCSRDRFGIKPFNYIYKDGEFYFASEYKPLKLSPHFSSELNTAQVSRALQLGWLVYRDESFFKCIHVLPPAHNLIFKQGKLEVKRYWDIDFSKKVNGSFEEKRERFRALFDDSIRLHLRSDVPVAATLSGGIDSSAIVSKVATMYPDQLFKTFSIYYEGKDSVDERPFVNEVINKYKNSLQPFYYSPGEKEIAEQFHNAVHHSDVPVTGSSFFSQYFVMQSIAAQKIKVVLSGQGADDYLGGYMHSFYRLFADLMRKMRFGKLITEMGAHRRMQDFTGGKMFDLTSKSLLSGMMGEESLYRTEYNRYFPFLSKEAGSVDLDNKGDSKLNAFLYQLMFMSSLPTLLHYEDRNSMAFSIESRVPFLDHRMVEYGFALSNEDKIKKGVTKHILREAAKDVLPEAIYKRKDKKGFVTPGEVKWLRGPLKYLLDDDLGRLEMIDQAKASAVVDAFRKGENRNANLVWRLASLNYWVKNFV